MGMLPLDRLMSMQREHRRRRRRRNTQSSDRSISLLGKRKGSPCQQDCIPDGRSTADQANNIKRSPCEQDDSSQSCKPEGYSGPNLPEDIWSHIHSLMPLRDAARAACVSRSFRYFWRFHSNLIFSKETLGLDGYAFGKEQRAHFTSRVDHIIESHSGTGVRTLGLYWAPDYTREDRCNLDRWLQMAVTPGIEELTLVLCSRNDKYKFPCSVLSNGKGGSIRHFYLGHCSFCPTAEHCCFKSLTRLDLHFVRITGDELWCLLSSSLALEWFSLRCCDKVICLKIPCSLQRLSYLQVLDCDKLKMIESKAPNLSRFDSAGNHQQIHISLGETLQVKNLHMCCSCYDSRFYSRAELASSTPNLGTLDTHPSRETIDAATSSRKLLHLECVTVALGGVSYVLSVNCACVVSFLGASPSLPAFISHVEAMMSHAFVSEDFSELWTVETSKSVVSTEKKKKMVELACHILKAWLS